MIAAALDPVGRLRRRGRRTSRTRSLNACERLQRRRQLVERPFGLRQPVRHRHAVRARRTRRAAAPARPPSSRSAVSAGTMLSSSGSASAAPRPRSTVRRDMCIFVMITCSDCRLVSLLQPARHRRCALAAARRIWNGVLCTMPEHQRRPAVLVAAQRRAPARAPSAHRGSSRPRPSA